MKKLYCLLIVAIAAALLSGCFDNGSTSSPPAGFTATPGDGRVMLTWIPDPSVEYWIFTATDPSLTAFNWTSLANAHAYIDTATPFYMCGLLTSTAGSINWTPYYFAANGRSSNGPGGASSPTIIETPYNASTYWHAGSVGSSTDLYGVGYASLTTCSNNTTSAAGSFAAVGSSGAIFTSTDGVTWTTPTSVPSGLPDLYAVTGYAANLNNPTTPGIVWIAVGAGGASIYSYDGITWYNGGALNTNTNSLRSITHSGSTFIAVGDTGTILSASAPGITLSGISWTTQNSGSSSNLYGVSHGNFYTAVGEYGTILTSLTGASNTWTAQTPATSETLRQVATNGNITVAVGDNGTIVTSTDGGVQWIAQYLQGSVTPNLVSVTAESQVVADALTDPALGYVPYAQFVALDSSGNAYTSVNGVNWSGPVTTGISSPNALVSSGFGYVAAGNAGTTAYAF
ncbi:MAG: hypothetical protein WCA63_07195 [Gallionella sp.]